MNYETTLKVRALQWTGDNLEAMQEFAGEPGKVASGGWLAFYYTESIPPQGWLVVKGDREDAWAETNEDFQKDYRESWPRITEDQATWPEYGTLCWFRKKPGVSMLGYFRITKEGPCFQMSSDHFMHFVGDVTHYTPVLPPPFEEQK